MSRMLHAVRYDKLLGTVTCAGVILLRLLVDQSKVKLIKTNWLVRTKLETLLKVGRQNYSVQSFTNFNSQERRFWVGPLRLEHLVHLVHLDYI